MKEVSIQEAWKRKYPEQVVFIVSADAQGKPSIMSAGWFMPVSGEPPLIAVSIGNNRYTKQLISENKEFVIAFPSEEMVKEVIFCGSHSGKSVDKFRKTGLKRLPSKRIKPPLIEGCLANFECKVVQEILTGDHILFIGEILSAHSSEEKKRRLFNLGGGHFGGI